MNIIDQFKTSIYKFHDYPLLLMGKSSRTVTYFLIFTMLISVLSIIPAINLYINTGGIGKLVDTYVPDFEIKDGKFSCKTIDKNQGMLIYINTEEDFDVEEKAKEAQIYFIANRDCYIINNGIVSEKGSFKDFENLSKAELVRIVRTPAFKISILIGVVITLIFSFFISGLVGLTMVVLMGNIINILITRAHITIGNMFRLAVYARTFPVLFSTVVALLGIELPLIIDFGLMITYMYLGLKNIKSGSGIILARID